MARIYRVIYGLIVHFSGMTLFGGRISNEWYDLLIRDYDIDIDEMYEYL